MPSVVVEPPRSHPGGSTMSLPADRHGLLLLAALVLYTAGFFIWFPTAFSITDEAHYVSGALALAHAASTGVLEGATAASASGEPPTTYPAGTSLLQAPFVGVFGWHAAAVASLAALGLVAAILWRWLREAGHSPAAVWLWLGFPPVLVLGRLAMSDVPAAACVVLGLYAFWKGSRDRATWRPWFAAGLATGGSLLLREPLVLILGPFAAGAMLRRERHSGVLVAGLAVACSLRLLTGQALYGDPLAVNPVGFGFSPGAVVETAPLYLVSLGLLVPGCLLWMPRYRGWRWPECHLAVWGTVAFFLFYNYAGLPGSGLRRLVLVGRFLIPLIPLLVWCAASSLVPWWARRAADSGRPRRAWIARLWVGGVVGGVIAVHPVLASWDRQQAVVAARIRGATPSDAAIVTVSDELVKYVHPGTGRRTLVSVNVADPEAVSALSRRGVPMFVVAAERSADDYGREMAALAQAYREALAHTCTLTVVVDEETVPGTRLRVHRVHACQEPARRTDGVSP